MQSIYRDIVANLVKQSPRTEVEFSVWNRRLAGVHKIPPVAKRTLSEVYHDMVDRKLIKQDTRFEKILQVRPVRTLSGVAPVTLLTKPFPCPGKCVYCPTEPNMPKSYLSTEPAAMRAVLNRFDPEHQIRTRLETYATNKHDASKIEIIVLGGTWSAYTKDYQDWFIRECYKTCNEFNKSQNHKIKKSSVGAGLAPVPGIPQRVGRATRATARVAPTKRGEDLKRHVRTMRDSYEEKKEEKVSLEDIAKQQLINEKTKHRIIGLCLETRPDWIKRDEIARMRAYGCTRVQLGIQSIYDDVLDLIKRGHRTDKSIWATKALKDAGLKVDHHYMPNLPGSSPARDLDMMREVFASQDFRPDQVKIYPTVVNEYAELKEWHDDGRWKSYSNEQLIELGIEIKKLIPQYVRINRFIRDIPEESIIAGNKVTNLRQDIQNEMAARGLACRCIRCREARGKKVDPENFRIFTEKYNASDGWEYFISAESPDREVLFSFVRLRIPSQFFAGGRFGEYQMSYPHDQLPELQGAALIRELHTYGSVVPVDEQEASAVQHKGFGKRMMEAAEETVRGLGIDKVAVISGVGVRNYYRKLGYDLEGTYMVKYL